MNLDEAIKHCMERANRDCSECANEHKQLAQWLIELKEFREAAKKKTREYWLCKNCTHFDGVGYCTSNKLGTRPDYLCVNYPIKRG